MKNNAIIWTAFIVLMAMLTSFSAFAAQSGGDGVVHITPDYPTEDQTLTCSIDGIGSYDPDGYLYNWYLNDEFDDRYSDYGMETYPASQTSIGDVIRCEVFMPDVLPPYLPVPISDDYVDSVTIQNRAPSLTLKSPADGSTNQDLSLVLSWDGNDPDGDTLSYDVYFGTSSSPPKVASGIAAESYQVSGLSYSTTYHWKIIVKDTHGASTTSDRWDFITKDKPVPPSVTINSPSEGSVFNAQDVKMEYLISQGGTIYIYDGSSNVYTTGNNAGSYDYTYTGLSRGPHTLKVKVENSNGQDTDSVNIRINKYPVLDPIGSRSVQEESTLSFGVSGSDPDGDAAFLRMVFLLALLFRVSRFCGRRRMVRMVCIM
ncbi:MAG: hypothetical protein GXP63_02560 [DPANN group archaeon]|nr:hypothetical protein [DPANN group archaeon]